MSTEELRRWYQSLSDEALANAYGQGSAGYTPGAWAVITAEIAARGLPQWSSSEASPASLPSDPEAVNPLTTEEASRLTWNLLESGRSSEEVSVSLEQRGLSSEEAERVVSAIAPTWQKKAEEAAGKEMLIGGVWCGGGLLVSAGTYALAREQGGTYLVAWGAVIYGAVRFVRGLNRLHDVGARAGAA